MAYKYGTVDDVDFFYNDVDLLLWHHIFSWRSKTVFLTQWYSSTALSHIPYSANIEVTYRIAQVKNAHKPILVPVVVT